MSTEQTAAGSLFDLLIDDHRKMQQLREQWHTRMRGVRVRFIADWRDQPFGSSKPSLKGREYTVSGVLIGLSDALPHLYLDGVANAVGLEFVELVPASGA